MTSQDHKQVYTREYSPFRYNLAKFGLQLFVRYNPFPRVISSEKPDDFSSDGPAIYMLTHQHSSDPFYQGLFLPSARFFAKTELFHSKTQGKLLSSFGAMPFDKNNPRSRDNIRYLNDFVDLLGTGGRLIFFPEGTRCIDGRIGEIQDGAIALPYRVLKKHGIMPSVYVGSQTYEHLPGWTARFHFRLNSELGFPEDITESSPSELKQLVREQLASATVVTPFMIIAQYLMNNEIKHTIDPDEYHDYLALKLIDISQLKGKQSKLGATLDPKLHFAIEREQMSKLAEKSVDSILLSLDTDDSEDVSMPTQYTSNHLVKASDYVSELAELPEEVEGDKKNRRNELRDFLGRNSLAWAIVYNSNRLKSIEEILSSRNNR